MSTLFWLALLSGGGEPPTPEQVEQSRWLFGIAGLVAAPFAFAMLCGLIRDSSPPDPEHLQPPYGKPGISVRPTQTIQA